MQSVTILVFGIWIMHGMTTSILQTPTLIHPSGSSPLVRNLVNEWTTMQCDQTALRKVNSWGLPGPRIKHLDEVLYRSGYSRPPKDSEGDQYLLQLVIRAADDDLATRIVLQRILPPLIAIASRRGRINVGGFNDAIVDTVSNAWVLIRTYPIVKRPAKVASNLVRDSEYRSFVHKTRVKELLTVPMSDNFEFLCEETSPERNAVEVLAELRSQLNTWTFSSKSRAMLDLLLGGVSQRDAAQEYGVSLRTIRAWQHTALIELRERMQYAA